MGAALLAVLLAAAPNMALADPGPTLGITIDPAIGTSVGTSSNGVKSTLPLLPLPLLQLRIPLKRFEFDAEGLPPIGPVGWGAAGTGETQASKLSYFSAALLYAIPNTPLRVGMGETLMNQQSDYTVGPYTNTYTIGEPGQPSEQYVQTLRGTETDASRVAGLRLVAEYDLVRTPVRSLSLDLALTQSMHAIVERDGTTTSSFSPPPPHGFFVGTSAFSEPAPENGTFLDAQLRATRQTRVGTFVYGLRYVNYSALLTQFDQTVLSDREALLLPFAGIEVPLEKRDRMSSLPAKVTEGHLDGRRLPDPAYQSQPTLALGLNPLLGMHLDNGRREAIPVLPLPFAELDVPLKRFSLRAQDLPMTGPMSYADRAPNQTQATKFGVLSGALLYAIPSTPLRVGLGETLYNQQTIFNSPPATSHFTGGLPPVQYTETLSNNDLDATRTAGLRYVAEYDVLRTPQRAVTLDVALTPSMHGSLNLNDLNWYSISPAPPDGRASGTNVVSQLEYENATQLEVQLRAQRTLRFGTLLYGVHYLNYSSLLSNGNFHFAGYPEKVFERNAFLSPFVGLQLPIARRR